LCLVGRLFSKFGVECLLHIGDMFLVREFTAFEFGVCMYAVARDQRRLSATVIFLVSKQCVRRRKQLQRALTPRLFVSHAAGGTSFKLTVRQSLAESHSS